MVRIFGTPDPQIRAEAAIWIARLHSDTRSPQDEANLRAWLEEQPAHRLVFDRMTETWDTAGALNPLEVDIRTEAARPSRRGILAGIGTVLAASGGFGIWSAAYAGTYETGVGERREVPLGDGSRLMLDTDTRVRVAFGSRPRTLYLYRGRVSLVVATDTARPFQIEAADKVVSAQGGMVDVRRDGDSVSVAVVNGGAEVLFVNDESERMQRLEAGQRLVAPSSAPARVDAPDLRQVTAWQNGQAIFDGDSLAEAATEMNRYSSRQIRIPDSEVRRLTISGVYQVGDTAAFADSVAAALPVRVRREPGGIALIAAPPTPQG